MPDINYLKLLAEKYPNRRSVRTEIINLRAILALPKATEFFLSDIHGEYDAFHHFVRSGSGMIRMRIDEVFGNILTESECDALASLIYNPEAEMARREKSENDFGAWCKVSIRRLIAICRVVSNKYTRSKVKKRLPIFSSYIMDELLFADNVLDRHKYYDEIIDTIIEYDAAREFIIDISETIANMVVDRLHIIGDIFDRGPKSHVVLDYLMANRGVDIQWGNHDILWMGAATGSWACITNVLRINTNYNNFDLLEVGYGINLRPLATMAAEVYADDPCKAFWPKTIERNKYDPVDDELAAKMNKAISICQFKVEGQRIMAHPEYHLENRLLLDKIDYEKGTIKLPIGEYPLNDTNFPTIDPADPYKLTPEEYAMLEALEPGFTKNDKLQSHIKFMFTHGALYNVVNGNLLFHGCIPMNEDGSFKECEINGHVLSGKAYMDYLDEHVRDAYFHPKDYEEIGFNGDIMWYLWLGANSPLFGKDQMTTLERCLIDDKKTHKEYTVPYYKLIERQDICESILREFGLDPEKSIILNGHVPVKIKDGESPIKGGGRLFIIDGGMSKAYQKTTGIAGYTFFINSRYMALAEHKPYSPLQEDGTQVFHAPVISIVRNMDKRMLVVDTDLGGELLREREELRALVEAYRDGSLKEH